MVYGGNQLAIIRIQSEYVYYRKANQKKKTEVTHMQVQEFMKKHGIGESRVRIFDAELGKEICGIFETGLYYDCEVSGAYPAGRNTVLEVASVNG